MLQPPPSETGVSVGRALEMGLLNHKVCALKHLMEAAKMFSEKAELFRSLATV